MGEQMEHHPDFELYGGPGVLMDRNKIIADRLRAIADQIEGREVYDVTLARSQYLDDVTTPADDSRKRKTAGHYLVVLSAPAPPDGRGDR
jgi:hypothetical protein